MMDKIPYILSSTVYSALLLSHGIRLDTKLILYFPNSIYISFTSSTLKNLRPDMQSIMGIFRKASSFLSKSEKTSKVFRILPGIVCGYKDFLGIIGSLGNLFFYEDKGIRIENISFPKNFKFLICYPNIESNYLKLLIEGGAKSVKIYSKYKLPGPIIMVINNYIDKQVGELL
ncbi:MAG: hypothetical protein QXR39_03115 [Candidatus Methanomethylicia archaeon]